MTITSVDILTVFAFCGISFLLTVVGMLLIGRDRNEAEGWQKRRLIFGELTHALAAVFPVRPVTLESLKRDLIRAGYYHRFASDEFLALRNTLLVSSVILMATALMVSVNPERDYGFLILSTGTVITLLAFALPRLVLQAQAAERLGKIERSLPDTLDMLTMVMSSGLSLQKSLQHVVQELDKSHPDLACELTFVERHTTTYSLEAALRKFAKRIDLPDVQSLAAVICQAERLGSNISLALQEFSDGIRSRRLQQAEERGNRNSILIMFPIVLCLAPPIYILLLGPALMELRGFILRENRPGGVLRPDVSELESSLGN